MSARSRDAEDLRWGPFLLGSGILLIGVVLAVLGAVAVPFVSAYVLTLLMTGWRDPGPGIIQGCEKSLTCSESGTFFITWAISMLGYIVVAVVVFRWALNRLAPRRSRRGEVAP